MLLFLINSKILCFESSYFLFVIPRLEPNGNQIENSGMQNNCGSFGENHFNRDAGEQRQSSNWRSEKTDSAGGFRNDTGRNRFDESRDSQQSNWRSGNTDSAAGGNKRFDDNRDGQRSYQRGENRESASGFNEDGGRKRFDDNRDSQRSYQNRDSSAGDGGRKRFDENRDNQRSYPRGENRDSDAGFKNRDQGDGANKFGDSDRPRRQPIRNGKFLQSHFVLI